MTDSSSTDDSNAQTESTTSPHTAAHEQPIDTHTLPPTSEELFTDGPAMVFQWESTDQWPVRYASPNVESILGYTLAELTADDLPFAELIHPDDRARVREEVTTHSDATTEVFTHKPYRLITADGSIRWVIDYTQIIRSEETITGYRGFLVDITAQKEYERGVDRINEAVQELLHLESVPEILETVTETATALRQSTATRWFLYDDDGGLTVPSNVDTADRKSETPAFEPGPNEPWQAYVTQTPKTTDTLTVDGTALAGSQHAIFPVGEHGVVVVSTTDESFDDRTIRLGTVLAATAEAALDRTSRTQSLKKIAQTHRSEIEALENRLEWYQTVHEIQTAITNLTDPARAVEKLCQQLTTIDTVAGAWVGEFGPDHDNPYLVAAAGIPGGYLDAITATVEPVPAVEVLESTAPVTESQIPSRTDQPAWRRAALTHGFHSAASVPLIYGEILHGICTVYSTQPAAFEGPAQSILVDAGQFTGAALTRMNEHKRMAGEDHTEVSFDLHLGSESVCQTLADRLDTEITIKHITQRTENSHHIHCVIDDNQVTPDMVTTSVEQSDHIESVTPVVSADVDVYELIIVDDPVLAQITQIDAIFRSFIITGSGEKLVLAIANDQTTDVLAAHVRDIFPDAHLIAKTQSESTNTLPWLKSLPDELTDKQIDTLKTAYYSGYFDETREQTGSEIAESLGIAQPTFSNRLRSAQRNLFAALWDR